MRILRMIIVPAPRTGTRSRAADGALNMSPFTLVSAGTGLAEVPSRYSAIEGFPNRRVNSSDKLREHGPQGANPLTQSPIW